MALSDVLVGTTMWLLVPDTVSHHLGDVPGVKGDAFILVTIHSQSPTASVR
jgi:hypothetical protein